MNKNSWFSLSMSLKKHTVYNNEKQSFADLRVITCIMLPFVTKVEKNENNYHGKYIILKSQNCKLNS